MERDQVDGMLGDWLDKLKEVDLMEVVGCLKWKGWNQWECDGCYGGEM